jgi:dodecin
MSEIEQTGEAPSGYLAVSFAFEPNTKEGDDMSVAKVSEISATSSKSFEDALLQGIARASKTLRNVKSAWVKEQQVRVEKGVITEYQVNMMVTFVIDD